MCVAMTLQIAFVLELLAAEFAAVHLGRVEVSRSQMAPQRRFPSEHLAAELAFDVFLLMSPHVDPQISLRWERPGTNFANEIVFFGTNLMDLS